jgi:hypothetical protein
VRWVDGVTLVAELDDQLRRAYWSWDWPVVSEKEREQLCDHQVHAKPSQCRDWCRAGCCRLCEPSI